MKLKNKSLITAIIALFISIATLAAGFFVAQRTTPVYAEAEQDYYYSQLNAEAKKFYDAIADMDEQGLLKQGNAQYDLIKSEVLTKAQLDSFSRSQTVLETFGAARDAYYLDHPELFYIDFSYLTVSVGTKGGEYVATLGTGRAKSYYVQGIYSEADVENAISSYNATLKEITDKADAFENVYDKVKSVNASLAETITYSFCDNNMDAAYAPHIRNAYGALVNKKAVCEGFARSFKCAMDKLGIPCVLVHGYASYEGGLEPHAWNYVKLDGNWYGVDPTWNNTAGNAESYLLCGADVMDKEHIADGVISASNAKFHYPLLATGSYGSTNDETIKVEATDQGDGTILYKVSADGMNGTQLSQKGLWLSCRYYSAYGTDLSWSNWMSINHMLKGMGMDEGDGYSPTAITSNVMYVQFGVINGTPNMFGTFEAANIYVVASTEYYENEGYKVHYGAPYVKQTSPDNNAANLDVTKTYDMEITYSEDLKKIDENKPEDLKVTTINADTAKYMEISPVTWDGKNKISFKFTPSAMYQHRDEVYTFTPSNLVGVNSGKVPMSTMYITKNNNVACNRVYPDGRLYVNTFGKPSLVGNGDLSMTGWTDKDGNPVSENQRSQLMLVATKTTEKEGKEMLNGTKLPEGAIKSSDTFEIELNLCKNIVKIPNGSKVQVAFGFPEGYGPEDEGVTFKVYHFKRGEDGKIDYANPEEVECVITEYGLMVNVSDFSPFAVVAVDKSQVQDVKKSVYARSVGFGGSFDGEVAQLVDDGQSVTYTLRPESGYKVAKATLNGEDIEVKNNTVTLSYAQLKDRNTVEFHYVAESVAEYEQTNGITALYAGDPDGSSNPILPETPDTSDTPGTSDTPTTPNTPNTSAKGDGGKPFSPAPIIVAVVVVLAVGAAIVVTLVLIKRKKK